MSQTEKRIVIVHNPYSTRSEKVQSGVFDRLDDAGIEYATHTTQHSDTEANIADMREVFRDGDTILSAAGDGTAMQVANAVLREGHTDTSIGMMGYGNFRDLGKEQDPLKLLAPSTRIVESHPMTIMVNDEYLRNSPGYMTLGFTALAASKFGSEKSREGLRGRPDWAKLVASIGQLGLDYFQMRDQKIPAFHTSESPIVRTAVTDILAINSMQVGRIIRSANDYAAGDTFGFRTNNVSSILPNIPFGLQALAGRAPAAQTDAMRIFFEQPSTVPFQTEGEFAELHDVNELFIYKDPAKILRLLHSAA